MSISVDVAATIAAVAGLVSVVGNFVLQVMQIRGQNEARAGRVTLNEKVDVTAAKVDETAAKIDLTATKVDANTALTQETADKINVVHAETIAIAETTGAHAILKMEGK